MPSIAWLLLSLTLSCGDPEPPERLESRPAQPPPSSPRRAQPPPRPPPLELDRQRMLDDVAYLASDELQGRRPGTEGNEAAVERAEEVFRAHGLSPAGQWGSYRQRFSYVRSFAKRPDRLELTVGGVRLPTGARGAWPIGFSGDGEVSSELIFVGYGVTIPPFERSAYPRCPVDPDQGFDEYAGLDVRGKVVLALRGLPPELGRDAQRRCPVTEACRTEGCLEHLGYKAQNALDHGAAAIILTSNPRQPEAIRRATTLQLPYFNPHFPALVAHRGRLEALIDDLGERAALIDDRLRPTSDTTGLTASLRLATGDDVVEAENVLALLAGVDPVLAEEVVVIGAHLDHLGPGRRGRIFNGADDNASGAAVMLELARLTASVGGPSRTVLFAAWNAEEEGLIGSCHFVYRPTIPLDRTVAAFSVDMVGAGDGEGLTLEGADEPMNAWLGELIDRAAAEEAPDRALWTTPQTMFSDHRCFAAEGMTAVLATTPGRRPHYHRVTDELEQINPEDLEGAARILWAGLRPLLWPD